MARDAVLMVPGRVVWGGLDAAVLLRLLDEREDSGRVMRRYEVRLSSVGSHVPAEPVLIGTVERTMRTWERRTAGRRYANARGQTPAWAFARVGEWPSRATMDTRMRAVGWLVSRYAQDMGLVRGVF